MYGRGYFKNVNAAHAAILKEKCGGLDGHINLCYNVDQLPSCQEAMHQHIRRHCGKKDISMILVSMVVITGDAA